MLSIFIEKNIKQLNLRHPTITKDDFLQESVLLYDMEQMGTLNEDVARRFLALVDEFYERKVKIIINATFFKN